MDYSTNESFQQWRQSFTREELEKAQASIAMAKHKKLKESTEKPVERSSSTRGPKPLSTPNPLHKLLVWALDAKYETPHGYGVKWLDDFVYGGCYVSAGVSKGKLNVSPSHVRYALLLPEINTASCRAEDMSKRTAQLVAQTTRWTLSGIQNYLALNPRAYFDLAKTKRLEEMVCYDPPSKHYGDSLDLYKAGDYLAYGLARQQETSGKTLYPA